MRQGLGAGEGGNITRVWKKGKAGNPLNKMIETFYNVLVNFRNIQWNNFGSLDLQLLPLGENRRVQLVNPAYILLFMNKAPIKIKTVTFVFNN